MKVLVFVIDESWGFDAKKFFFRILSSGVAPERTSPGRVLIQITAITQWSCERSEIRIVLILTISVLIDIGGVNKAHRSKKRDELILHNVFRWSFYCVPYIWWKRRKRAIFPRNSLQTNQLSLCGRSLTLL